MKTVWEKYKDSELKKVQKFSGDYRDFLSLTKTEREFVRETIKLVKQEGFVNLE